VTAAACACGQPSPDAGLCNDCTHDLRLALFTAAWLGPQLDLARSRQATMGERNGSRASSHPLPYDPPAAAAADHLAAVLGGVLRDLNLPATTEAKPA
jgi:hypothetical protein